MLTRTHRCACMCTGTMHHVEEEMLAFYSIEKLRAEGKIKPYQKPRAEGEASDEDEPAEADWMRR